MSGPSTIAPALLSISPASPQQPRGATASEFEPAKAPEEKDPTKGTSPETVAEAVKDFSSAQTKSRLSIDHDAFVQAFVYRSVDNQTGEVIQQWPGEDALKLRRYLRELAGLVVDELA